MESRGKEGDLLEKGVLVGLSLDQEVQLCHPTAFLYQGFFPIANWPQLIIVVPAPMQSSSICLWPYPCHTRLHSYNLATQMSFQTLWGEVSLSSWPLSSGQKVKIP